MDGDPVEGEPSNEPVTLADIFSAVFPQYLAMGMTYDEFWYGCPSLVRDYRKAYEIKRHNEEWARWRSGAYFFCALLKAAPVLRAFGKGDVKPGEYPAEPWPLTEKEAREREEAREKEKYERYLAKMNADSERELKRRAQMAKEAKENGQSD